MRRDRHRLRLKAIRSIRAERRAARMILARSALGWSRVRLHAGADCRPRLVYLAGTIGLPLPGPGAGGTSAPAGVLVLGADRAGGGASICNGRAGGGAAGPRDPGVGLSVPHAGDAGPPAASPQVGGGPAGTMGSAEADAAAMISETDTPAGAIQRRHARIWITAISGHRRRRPSCPPWPWKSTRSRTNAG